MPPYALDPGRLFQNVKSLGNPCRVGRNQHGLAAFSTKLLVRTENPCRGTELIPRLKTFRVEPQADFGVSVFDSFSPREVMEVEGHRLPRLDQKPGVFRVEVEGRARPTKLRKAAVAMVA